MLLQPRRDCSCCQRPKRGRGSALPWNVPEPDTGAAQETRDPQSPPALRFRVDDERIVSFTDLLAGPLKQHVQQTIGDFIICRSDDIFAYQFAVVVDDALMHINQVVRGTDLLQSTPRQILLYEALRFPVPTFAHVPLLLDEHGKRFYKRI